jgi:hypothetical protein
LEWAKIGDESFLSEIISRPVNEADAYLKRLWRPVFNGAVRELCVTLGVYSLKAFVFQDPECPMISPSSSFGKARDDRPPLLILTKDSKNRLVLAPPRQDADRVSQLVPVSDPARCLVEFYRLFPHLGYALPPLSGYFPLPEKLERFSVLRHDQTKENEPYQDAWMIHTALNGDKLLLSEDYGVTWYCFPEDRFIPVCTGLETLVSRLATTLRLRSRLDSYEYGDQMTEFVV